MAVLVLVIVTVNERKAAEENARDCASSVTRRIDDDFSDYTSYDFDPFYDDCMDRRSPQTGVERD
ncbi:MAG: hypothetical protein O3C27_02310 [Actinomycetota bacterium]|nr:hypothetical protein [Actinomycetota bacterium]